MTDQEVRDEGKESEGNPEVKRKIRSTQLQRLRQRLQQAVPKSTVVITNPTHYAVALAYDSQRDNAPRIMARGCDLIAHEIRMLAVANAIPIYEAPVLARAIYHSGKVGREIHPGLYMAVAIVLSYVHQLKSFQVGVGAAPVPVYEFDIPTELIFKE